MANSRWVKVSLRAVSGVLTAESIEQALATNATTKANAGDRVSQRSPAAGVHPQAVCIFDCPMPSGSALDEHLNWLSSLLDQNAAGIESIASLCEFDVRIGLAAGCGQGGFVVTAEQLAWLNRLEMRLFIDLYPPADDGDDE